MTNQTYFDSFSSAVQVARAGAEKRGYQINQSDWDSQITFGVGRPKNGSTTRATIELTKEGKKTKRYLAIQVYDMGRDRNTFELNWYIS